jgi:apolipoprotein N-acyltransferase
MSTDNPPAPLVIEQGIVERVRGIFVDFRPRWIGLIAAGAGLFTNLAHAPFHFWPAMAVSFTILVWLIDGAVKKPEKRVLAAFWRGWCFASGYFFGGLFWVYNAFNVDAETFGYLAPFAVVFLACGLALFWGAAMAVVTLVWSNDLRRLFMFTVAVMAAEFVRGHLFGGFPWDLPGAVWPAGGAISQLASTIGLYGLSALTVFALSSPAILVDDRGEFGARAVPVVASALMGGLLWGLGAQRLSQPEPPPQGPLVRVVDPGFTQAEKWKKGNASEVLEAYLKLTGGPDSPAPIVIWPEGALPFLTLETPQALDLIGSRLGPRTLVIGVARREEQADGSLKLYNSMALLRKDVQGVRPIAFYDKNRLTPFGEFIPLFNIVQGLGVRALQQIGDGFTPGPPPIAMDIPGGPQFAPMICYEALFPGLMPRDDPKTADTNERPRWIINITNDAWFGRTTGPWQHWNQTRYRAIEEGLPIVRSASGGMSGIIDARGRSIDFVGIDGGVVEGQVPAALVPTFYSQFGEWTLLGILVAFLALGFGLPTGRDTREGY